MRFICVSHSYMYFKAYDHFDCPQQVYYLDGLPDNGFSRSVFISIMDDCGYVAKGGSLTVSIQQGGTAG